jgi:hypothetical protein
MKQPRLYRFLIPMAAMIAIGFVLSQTSQAASKSEHITAHGPITVSTAVCLPTSLLASSTSTPTCYSITGSNLTENKKRTGSLSAMITASNCAAHTAKVTCCSVTLGTGQSETLTIGGPTDIISMMFSGTMCSNGSTKNPKQTFKVATWNTIASSSDETGKGKESFEFNPDTGDGKISISGELHATETPTESPTATAMPSIGLPTGTATGCIPLVTCPSATPTPLGASPSPTSIPTVTATAIPTFSATAVPTFTAIPTGVPTL